jgi:hypothetical protein
LIQNTEYSYDGCIGCPNVGESGDLHIAADGNFRLFRRKNAGKYNIREASKSPYVLVDQSLRNIRERDEQGCSSVFRARSSGKKSNYDQTGVFGLFCARHEMPLKFVDMFSGERFIYPVKLLQSLLDDPLRKTYLYYDLACKLMPHISRVGSLQYYKMIGCVPKLHAHVHEWKCYRKYHPLRIPGTAETDGETSERVWSYLGRFSLITREMLEANRQDLLADAWNYFRIKKQSSLLSSLKRKFRKKTEEYKEKEEAFFKLNLSEEDADRLAESERNGDLTSQLPGT